MARSSDRSVAIGDLHSRYRSMYINNDAVQVIEKIGASDGRTSWSIFGGPT